MNLVSGRWQTFWTQIISYLSKKLSVLLNIYPCTALLTPNSNIVFGLVCVSVSFAQLECDDDKILVEMWVFTNLFQPQKDNLTWSIFKMQLILTLSPIFFKLLSFILLRLHYYNTPLPLFFPLSLSCSVSLPLSSNKETVTMRACVLGHGERLCYWLAWWAAFSLFLSHNPHNPPVLAANTTHTSGPQGH